MQEWTVPRVLPPVELRRLGEFFLESGYTEEGLSQLVGSFPPGTSHAKIALLLDAGGPATALTTLTRIFQLGRTAGRQQVSDVLPSWVVDTSKRTGLLMEDGDDWRSGLRIDCIGQTLLLSDSIHAGAIKRDFVTGFNRYAKQLLDLTPRVEVKDALDAFSGGGIQALHLAKHCQSVAATEFNSRAVEVAQLNAALNGIEAIDWLLGDRFAPVKGRQFDFDCGESAFLCRSRSGSSL